MAQSQWIIMLVAAGVAAVALVRLFLVLGRKSGTEYPSVPQTGGLARDLPAATAPLPAPAKLDAPGLFELSLADKDFDAAKFLAGARSAYGLIVTAFEKGDAKALRPLVSPDVLEGFSAAIAARGTAPSRFHFSEVRDAAIEQAAVQGGVMEITVRFEAAFETAEKVGAPHEITDRWTFSRAAGSADPNWTLVATAGEAA
jgi:predicted lipid-binding transport protein (Tim44 family)